MGGYTLVQRIEPYALAKSGRQVKLTLRASSATAYGAFIERIYISQPAPGGYPYDSAVDLTEVNPKFNIPGGQALTLPWVRYTLDAEQPLLIAVDFTELTGIKYRLVKTRGGGPFGLPPVLPIGIAYRHTGLEAALRNRSADYGSVNRIYFIERIEVR